MTTQDPMIGAVLGSYRITGPLSAGGMGTVYRATHELLGRPVAIKCLRPDATGTGELVQRFFNEAKAATAIQHPGIVEIYDFGYTDAGHAYYVMELLDGEPLSQAIARRGRFDEAGAVEIARSIASVLASTHARGIVHRDLKPDNIFLLSGRALHVKVLDFGIAKLANPGDASPRTKTGALLGTPKYMAPEQARAAARIDARADLYSLGCILYEMLVGQPPFVADGAGELIAMHLFSEPEPPSTHVAVSPAIEQLVLRLLAKEPGDRPPSAGALFAAAPRAVAPVTPMPVARRSRRSYALGGLAVVIAAGAAGAAVLATRSEAPRAPVVTPVAPPVVIPETVVASPPPIDAPPAPAVVETKRAPKRDARIAKPRPKAPLKTDNNSPIETDVGDLSPKTP